jgi:hypothetical protein
MLASGFIPEVSMHLANVQSTLANGEILPDREHFIRDQARAVSPNM